MTETRQPRRALRTGSVAAVLAALLLSAGFAALGAWLLGLPFGQLWLAFAPGGVEAMAVTIRMPHAPEPLIRTKLERAAATCPVKHALSKDLAVSVAFVWG